jgi:hypothetical protein
LYVFIYFLFCLFSIIIFQMFTEESGRSEMAGVGNVTALVVVG